MTTGAEREIESLLRGEIAAAETYKQVLEGANGPAAATLRDIQLDHGAAIDFLYHQLTSRGVEAPKTSGVWGFFARSVEGTAKMFGDKAAWAALREGEKTGLHQYEKALETGLLPEACRSFVWLERIPAQRRHIVALDRAMQAL